MITITAKPVWLTLDCTNCEGAVIVLIKHSPLGHAGFASGICPHCDGLQEWPIIGEVVFFEKDFGMRRPADISQPMIDRAHSSASR
jgi:hypothetical protein